MRTVELTVAEQIKWLEGKTKGTEKVLANFVEVSECVRGWNGSTESKLNARFNCYNRRYQTATDQVEYCCQEIDFECISVTISYCSQAGTVNNIGISPITRVTSRKTGESIMVDVQALLTESNKWSRTF